MDERIEMTKVFTRLTEDEIAKFLTKTERKKCKNIRKKFCSMDLIIVSVSWWNNIKYLIDSSSTTGVTRPGSLAHLLHDTLVYPPKMYLPTLIIVTVGPLSSHREWNVLAAQPSTDARQQRFQRELLLCTTGYNQPVKILK